MTNTHQFDTVKTPEEFLSIFQGLCAIAEFAFNDFEKQFETPVDRDAAAIRKSMSYLMSITFVIMGMRGDYAGFREGEFLKHFYVQVRGG